MKKKTQIQPKLRPMPNTNPSPSPPKPQAMQIYRVPRVVDDAKLPTFDSLVRISSSYFRKLEEIVVGIVTLLHWRKTFLRILNEQSLLQIFNVLWGIFYNGHELIILLANCQVPNLVGFGHLVRFEWTFVWASTVWWSCTLLQSNVRHLILSNYDGDWDHLTKQ